MVYSTNSTQFQGVREDVMQIILNIKGIAVKSYVEDEKKIELDVVGPAEVTAGDILTDSDIEIVNPDHYLFTIAEGKTFKAILTVNSGRGYVPAEGNKKDEAPVGTLAVDSIYTPVKKKSIIKLNQPVLVATMVLTN